LSDALCKYHTYDENTFVDSIGTVPNPDITGNPTAVASARPVLRPYYDTNAITYNVPNNPGWRTREQ